MSTDRSAPHTLAVSVPWGGGLVVYHRGEVLVLRVSKHATNHKGRPHLQVHAPESFRVVRSELVPATFEALSQCPPRPSSPRLADLPSPPPAPLYERARRRPGGSWNRDDSGA